MSTDVVCAQIELYSRELKMPGLRSSFSEIVRDYYPDLTVDDVRSCLQHAIDVVALEDIHLTTTNS